MFDLNNDCLSGRMVILLKGDQVARILNISRSYAFLLMRRGDIPTIKLGRSVRVKLSDLEHFINSNSVIRED